MNDQRIRLYIVPGVQEDTKFNTLTRYSGIYLTVQKKKDVMRTIVNDAEETCPECADNITDGNASEKAINCQCIVTLYF